MLTVSAGEKETFEKRLPARVFVMEDVELLRLGLCAFLKEEAGIECCGETDRHDDAILAIQPDLVLLGTSPEDPGAVKSMAELQASGVSGKVIVLAQRENVARAETALRRGASGFLTKEEPAKILREAIQTVLKGDVFVSPKLRSKLVDRVIAGGEGSATPLDHLTNREHEVLELIGSGMKTSEIASQLGLSSKTVDVHRGNIKKKLKIQSVNELIYFAARLFE